jgi:hypothetical protein
MKTYTTVSVLALLGGSDAFVPVSSFLQPAAHVSVARAAAPAAVRMVATEQAQTSKVKRNENFGKLTVSERSKTHVCKPWEPVDLTRAAISLQCNRCTCATSNAAT